MKECQGIKKDKIKKLNETNLPTIVIRRCEKKSSEAKHSCAFNFLAIESNQYLASDHSSKSKFYLDTLEKTALKIKLK